jgi:hypothetical protein
MRVFAMSLAAAILSAGACSAADESPAAGEHTAPTDWVQLHAGKAFSLRAPPGTVAVPVQGIDSFVGAIQSSTLDIGFDYGRWSNTLDGFEGDARFVTQVETVDGRPARIISGSGLGDETWGCAGYLTAIYVVDRREHGTPIALTMYVCAKDAKDAEVAKEIVRTIRFP